VICVSPLSTCFVPVYFPRSPVLRLCFRGSCCCSSRGVALAFTRHASTSSRLGTNQSFFHSSRPPALATLLQYYCTTVGQYMTPPRPPVCMLYTVQYWLYQYRVKAKRHGDPGPPPVSRQLPSGSPLIPQPGRAGCARARRSLHLLCTRHDAAGS